MHFHYSYPSSPEPDAEAEEEDDDGGGEDCVGDAADAGQDLDAEQVEPAAMEQPVIHGVALQMAVLEQFFSQTFKFSRND